MSTPTSGTGHLHDGHIVDVRGAGVALGGRPIVRGIDLAVHPGEVVALLGANGSGKSTLVKAMVGLHPLSTGEIDLFGEPLVDFHEWHRLGYVPQRSPIAQGVPSTVAEVVSAGRLSRRKPFMPARRSDRAAVSRALEAVGLSDRARHPVSTLSGGQQQRVLIARTLAGEPELLVLDEPNAGVDLESQEAIAGTLASLAIGGATIVVVLHELGHLAEVIQRSVVLREGRIVYDGPPHSSPTEHAHHDHDHHHRQSTPPVLRPPVKAPLDGRA
jgi:zinc transport system ATP-binding protein